MKRNLKLQRRKRLCRSIRLVWSSLKTHMDHAIKAPKDDPHGACGTEQFNATAIREYAEVILTLASELEQLT